MIIDIFLQYLHYNGTNMKINKELEKLIIEDYSKFSAIEIAKKYEICFSSVYKVIKRNNLSKCFKHRNRKYAVNEDYFSVIDTEEKAYFLGFMYADGAILIDNGTIRLGLQEPDVKILKTFQKLLESNRPLRYIPKRKETHQNSYILEISSKKMINDLQRQGCFVRKTFILEFPTENQVPNHLINHFIRGYFDGDGCISITDKVKKFCIISTRNFLLKLQDRLITNCSLNRTKISQANKGDNIIICSLVYNGRGSVYKLGKYLYKDATIFLERKKDKFDKIVPKYKLKIM